MLTAAVSRVRDDSSTTATAAYAALLIVTTAISLRTAGRNTFIAYGLCAASASRRHGRPRELDIDDLDAPMIGAFLTHLEQDRGNSARTRNARLAAIHSLYRYMAIRHPEHLQTIGRVIAIPFKRHEQNSVNYLNLDEIKALLRAPDRTTWLGRRDHALLLTAIQTGVRVTELVTLNISNVSLDTGAHCRGTGKGRKKRTATLTRETVAVLRQWLKERQGEPEEPLFPTRQGRPLTRSGVGQLLAKHAATATVACPSLKTIRLVARNRSLLHPPLGQHVTAVTVEHLLHRTVRHNRRRTRDNTNLPQVPNRQHHAPRRQPRRITSRTTRQQEPLHALRPQLASSQPLALKPTAQQLKLPQPMADRPLRIAPSRQPRPIPRRVRRQRPRSDRQPQPSTHHGLPSDRPNRTWEASTRRGRLCSAAHAAKSITQGKRSPRAASRT